MYVKGLLKVNNLAFFICFSSTLTPFNLSWLPSIMIASARSWCNARKCHDCGLGVGRGSSKFIFFRWALSMLPAILICVFLLLRNTEYPSDSLIPGPSPSLFLSWFTWLLLHLFWRIGQLHTYMLTLESAHVLVVFFSECTCLNRIKKYDSTKLKRITLVSRCQHHLFRCSLKALNVFLIPSHWWCILGVGAVRYAEFVSSSDIIWIQRLCWCFPTPIL